jgi:hypothetical protein
MQSSLHGAGLFEVGRDGEASGSVVEGDAHALTKKPIPADVTQGWLWLGVGSKGAAVINDVRQTGDGK